MGNHTKSFTNYSHLKIPVFFRSQKFYSLSASVLNSAIALLTFSLLARVLTKEDFGLWSFFLATYGFFGMALNGLLRTPVIRMAANKTEYNYNDVLASAWDILIKLSLTLGIIVGAGFLIAYFITNNGSYLNSSYWFLLLIIADIPGLIAGWNCNARMKFQYILVIRLISASSFFAGVLYIYLTDGNLSHVFWFYLLSSLTVASLVLIKKWSGFQSYLNHKKSYRKDIIDFGKYSMGTTISSSLLGSSDAFLITYFLGPSALALYEVPRRINGIYDIPLRSILQLCYPYLAKKSGETDRSGFQKEFERLAGFTFLVLLPIALGIFIYADFLVTLLGGEDYKDSSIILQVFAVFLLISPLDRFSGLVLDVLNRPNVNLTKVLIMLVTNVIGNIVAIKLGYGLVGVAFVTILSAVAGISYGFYRHRKEVPLRPLQFTRQGLKEALILTRSVLKK